VAFLPALLAQVLLAVPLDLGSADDMEALADLACLQPTDRDRIAHAAGRKSKQRGSLIHGVLAVPHAPLHYLYYTQ
jgi:hypothetical protein